MVQRLLLAAMLVTVLSAGAVSVRQIAAPVKFLPSCPTPFCSQAHPSCGGCFCNLPDGICTRDPIGPAAPK